MRNLANLVTALAVMAIVAAALISFAGGIGPDLAVERGAEQLAAELQAVRQLAVAEKATYDVIFERADRAYYIRQASMYATTRRVDLPPGVEWVHFPARTISFYGSGHCSIGGTISLIHRDSNLWIKVIVAPQSGRVRVERGLWIDAGTTAD